MRRHGGQLHTRGGEDVVELPSLDIEPVLGAGAGIDLLVQPRGSVDPKGLRGTASVLNKVVSQGMVLYYL